MVCTEIWPFCAQQLSEAELIAVLLEESSSSPTARELSGAGASLRALMVPDEQLRQQPWFTDAVLKVRVGFELAQRRTWANATDGNPVFDRMEAIGNYLCQRYAGSHQEVVGALYMNSRDRLIGVEELFRGTICRAMVEPRAILVGALRHHAVSLILFHNHPSGELDPSGDDGAFTRRLKKAADVMGMCLIDHILVAGHRWVSIQTSGGLQ